MRAIRDKATYANVAATLALVVAMGGGAYAASLPRGSVGTAQLQNGAVTSPKIAAKAVKTAKVKNGAITTSKIATDAVTSTKVKDESIYGNDIAPGVIPVGVSGYQVVQVESAVDPTSNSVLLIADCPSNTQILGGGVGALQANLSTNGGQRVVVSHPFSEGWQAIVYNGNASSQTAQVYAICANLGS
jgi:hypothetical protein